MAGRLTTDELEERLTATYAARTLAELSALRRDLPTNNPITAIGDAARRRHLARRVIQETGGSLGLFVVSTVIWLSSGASGQFWPIWVLLIFVLSLFRNGWALFGPAPDLDEVERDLDARRQKRLQKLEDRSTDAATGGGVATARTRTGPSPRRWRRPRRAGRRDWGAGSSPTGSGPSPHGASR